MKSLLQEADELLPKAEKSTLVIHMADPSTDFLKVIYAGLGYDTITGRIEPDELLEQIENHDRIFMLGHGGPSGLFGPGYIIGREFGPVLAEKEGLYIWCHAVEYAHEHKLTGLVSGMFISEVGEASWEGIKATQEQIDASNYAFSRAVRKYLDTGASPHEVKTCYSDAECQVTQYNNERLYVMRGGRIIDNLGQEQSNELSAKKGSPRYRRPLPDLKPQQGAYGDLDEPPDEFKDSYGWEPKKYLTLPDVTRNAQVMEAVLQAMRKHKENEALMADAIHAVLASYSGFRGFTGMKGLAKSIAHHYTQRRRRKK